MFVLWGWKGPCGWDKERPAEVAGAPQPGRSSPGHSPRPRGRGVSGWGRGRNAKTRGGKVTEKQEEGIFNKERGRKSVNSTSAAGLSRGAGPRGVPVRTESHSTLLHTGLEAPWGNVGQPATVTVSSSSDEEESRCSCLTRGAGSGLSSPATQGELRSEPRSAGAHFTSALPSAALRRVPSCRGARGRAGRPGAQKACLESGRPC